MTQLVWNAIGERIFEAGVDRGVLYIDGADGVPWNGLVSISESPSGGEVTPYYVDGQRYLNVASIEEFEATIEAYTYPDEFGVCDGTVQIKNGLFATQQRRKSFGLSYRTKIGNDVDGIDHGYKLHLIYDALASPTERSNHTMSDSIDPFNFSWHVVARPPVISGIRPTSHFIIDSRDTPLDLIDRITNILYGTSNTVPRLPSILELMFIFNEYQASVFDAGHLTEQYFAAFDSGVLSELQTSTIDGGTP